MPSNLTIPNIILDDPELSAEAEKIASEAAAPVKAWIEKSVNDLAEKTMATVTEAAAALRKNLDAIDQQLAASQQSYQAILAQLQKLPVSFDNAKLDAAAADLKKTTAAAADALEVQRKSYQDIGKHAGETAIGLLKSVFL